MKLDNNISLRNKLLNTDWGNAFSEQQKEEILRGIDCGVDASKYADHRYNKEQMIEIRNGLINGEDISIYADPIYSEHMMRLIREQMRLNKES